MRLLQYNLEAAPGDNGRSLVATKNFLSHRISCRHAWLMLTGKSLSSF
jgi:hypothetical protein